MCIVLKFVIVILVVFELNVVGAQEVDTKQIFLFPDDVRFAKRRCEEEFARNNTFLLEKWRKHEYPDQRETHCFIKCYLRRLGLVNLLTRGLDNDKLYQLWENIDLETSENCLANLELEFDLNDLCVSYYKKWLRLRQKCEQEVQKLFYELGPNYEYPMKYQLPSKAFEMSAIEFCESLDTMEKNTVAEMTQSVNVESEQFQCKFGCIYKRFHYFDAYDRLDESEIIRSFLEVANISESNLLAIKHCIHQAQMLYTGLERGYCNMAYVLHKCLTNRFGKQFKIVTINRNKLSKQY
uniref:Odorant binding protein 18 n=1 Tax=Liriomyza sativae TaxID=127406 RepID=A0A1P7ZIK6_LIRSA|nr:odorant binding protein 18 [Liriomyza sativae]